MTNEEKNKILEILYHLANKAEALATQLRNEDLSTQGVGVFLMMLEANQVSEALEFLHEELNIKK